MTRAEPPTLLQQLLDQEGTAYVLRLLDGAVNDRTRAIARVELDRFEVTIDHEQGHVVVEDVLEPPGVGVERITVGELAAALADRVARHERGGSGET